MGMLPFAIMGAISGVAGMYNPIPQESWGNADSCLRILYENDSPFGVDREYTHGTRIDYAQSFGRRHSGIDMGWGASLTQNIYTPRTHAAHAIPGEHPYAGYMAAGGAFFARGTEGCPWGTLMELQLGVTGKPSLAHGMQHFIHGLGDMPQWRGWHDQVPSEPTIQFSQTAAVKIKKLSRSFGFWESEAQAYGRYDVGTVLISGGAGMNFRVGHNLPDSMPIHCNRPSNYGIGLVGKGGDMTKYDPSSVSYYLTAGVLGEYVARDFSIDGGAFRSFERTCSRQPWQLEGQLGVGVTYKGIDYFMGAIIHSRTYRSQPDNHHAYGTFSVSWRW